VGCTSNVMKPPPRPSKTLGPGSVPPAGILTPNPTATPFGGGISCPGLGGGGIATGPIPVAVEVTDDDGVDVAGGGGGIVGPSEGFIDAGGGHGICGCCGAWPRPDP